MIYLLIFHGAEGMVLLARFFWSLVAAVLQIIILVVCTATYYGTWYQTGTEVKWNNLRCQSYWSMLTGYSRKSKCIIWVYFIISTWLLTDLDAGTNILSSWFTFLVQSHTCSTIVFVLHYWANPQLPYFGWFKMSIHKFLLWSFSGYHSFWFSCSTLLFSCVVWDDQ